jgi:hypothetical protein
LQVVVEVVVVLESHAGVCKHIADHIHNLGVCDDTKARARYKMVVTQLVPALAGYAPDCASIAPSGVQTCTDTPRSSNHCGIFEDLVRTFVPDAGWWDES